MGMMLNVKFSFNVSILFLKHSILLHEFYNKQCGEMQSPS